MRDCPSNHSRFEGMLADLETETQVPAVPPENNTVVCGPWFLGGALLVAVAILLSAWFTSRWVGRAIHCCRRPAQPPQGTVGPPHCS